MRIVFMGTPDFAVPSLQALVHEGYEIGAVFTQPDRPAGRGKALRPSPVKAAAEALGLPVRQPEKVKDPAVLAELMTLRPDGIVVVAYGQILPPVILTLPPLGCINVHASLLPLYRGAAPIHWAVINGEKATGVTTMKMDSGLDTGDILLKQDFQIEPDATTGEVHDALAALGAELLPKTLRGLEAGSLRPEPQTGLSNYAPMLTREHERIDWRRPAADIYNQVRGLNPWPGAFTTFRGEVLKIWRSRPVTEVPDLPGSFTVSADPSGPGHAVAIQAAGLPGEVRGLTDNGIMIQAWDTVLEIREVQPAGKRPMPALDYWRGRRGQAGEVFG